MVVRAFNESYNKYDEIKDALKIQGHKIIYTINLMGQ